MLIDLHTHTLHHSLDSGLKLETLLAAARQRGLNGVCLTEHNSLWRYEDVVGPAQRHSLTVLRGMEVGTDAGHVLVFGVGGFTLEMLNLRRLHRIVEQEGGAMVLAHPWRTSRRLAPGRDEIRQMFDAVEVLNGSDSNGSNSYMMRMMSEMGMVGIGGSDAHSVGPIGTVATQFDSHIKSEADLVAALKTGSVRAVWLQRNGHNPMRS